jgi:ClpP class serine protease
LPNARGADTRMDGPSMEFTNVIWIFFIFAALQPMFRQRMLEALRKRKIVAIEAKRNSRAILLVHRQETMSFLGFPVLKFINMDDAEAVIHAIDMTDPDVPIDLILHTPGGLALASFQIARAINARPGKVTVFIPHYAMSGGTLIALAADEIVMSKHAVLGPVDPQLGEYPAASILRVLRDKPAAEIEDRTLILADQAEKALNDLKTSVTEILGEHYPAESVERLAEVLTQGTWTHDHPITVTRAQELGLNVNTEMLPEILELLTLYPQPVRRTATVEFTPEPKRSPPTAN